MNVRGAILKPYATRDTALIVCRGPTCIIRHVYPWAMSSNSITDHGDSPNHPRMFPECSMGTRQSLCEPFVGSVAKNRLRYKKSGFGHLSLRGVN